MMDATQSTAPPQSSELTLTRYCSHEDKLSMEHWDIFRPVQATQERKFVLTCESMRRIRGHTFVPWPQKQLNLKP